jgi:EAL domain-containing protein (putative c-di-GMP-specific phosphodiesterase class I)
MAYVQRQAYGDYWTGRHNWRWFEDKVPGLIHDDLQKECREGKLVVVDIMISRVELLDEAYGHEFVARRIKDITAKMLKDNASIRALAVAGLAGRIRVLDVMSGTDETYRKQLEKQLQQYGIMYIHAVRRSIVLKAGICRVTSPGRLKRAAYGADMACSEYYGAAGKVNWFDQEMKQRIGLYQQIEALMLKALDRHEFQVWYQPKYDIRTHDTIGAEALVRWDSPELGFLMPGKFIHIFEINGFVSKLDFYILEEVCRLQRARLDAGQKTVCISVNQSRMHFLEDDYLDHIRQIKEKYDLPAGLIEFELTETAFSIFTHVSQRQHAIYTIMALHDMGYKISMDDFGSGYSSMELLNTLPLDVMKIDRTLLSGRSSERVEKVLASAISMGHLLDMQVICEGIEKPEQEQLLLRNGCHLGQGYLFAKAMAQKDFEQFLVDGQKPASQA